MALTTKEIIVLAILLLCVPLQVMLTHQSQLTHEEKNIRLQQILLKCSKFILFLTSPVAWINSVFNFQNLFTEDYSHWYPDDGDPVGECPAVEVLRFLSPEEHFALSPYPRNDRHSSVKFRVGQVIQHAYYQYRGVIIGWDEYCKAPVDWLEVLHRDHEDLKGVPHYAVLVDVRDRKEPQMVYIAQENIQIIKNVVEHPLMSNYFNYFDGAQYIPQPWLKMLYPKD